LTCKIFSSSLFAHSFFSSFLHSISLASFVLLWTWPKVRKTTEDLPEEHPAVDQDAVAAEVEDEDEVGDKVNIWMTSRILRFTTLWTVSTIHVYSLHQTRQLNCFSQNKDRWTASTTVQEVVVVAVAEEQMDRLHLEEEPNLHADLTPLEDAAEQGILSTYRETSKRPALDEGRAVLDGVAVVAGGVSSPKRELVHLYQRSCMKTGRSSVPLPLCVQR
jgi:hypothetical protein